MGRVCLICNNLLDVVPSSSVMTRLASGTCTQACVGSEEAVVESTWMYDWKAVGSGPTGLQVFMLPSPPPQV